MLRPEHSASTNFATWAFYSSNYCCIVVNIENKMVSAQKPGKKLWFSAINRESNAEDNSVLYPYIVAACKSNCGNSNFNNNIHISWFLFPTSRHPFRNGDCCIFHIPSPLYGMGAVVFHYYT